MSQSENKTHPGYAAAETRVMGLTDRQCVRPNRLGAA